jgi:hypothetical protein
MINLIAQSSLILLALAFVIGMTWVWHRTGKD